MDESPGSRLQRESAAAWTSSTDGPSFLRQIVPADSSSDAADSANGAADTSSATSASVSPSPETKQSSATADSSDTATSPGKGTKSENKQSDPKPLQQQPPQQPEEQPQQQQAASFGQVLPTQGDLASLPDCTRQLAAFPKLNRSDEAVRRFACIADTYLHPWMGSSLVKKGGVGGAAEEEGPRGIISQAMLQYMASEPGFMSCSGHIRIIDGQVYFRYGGFHYQWDRLHRFVQSVKLIQAAIRHYSLLALRAEFFLSTCDLPKSFDSSLSGIFGGRPIFSTEWLPGTLDIIVPDPLDLSESYQAGKDAKTPWEQKASRAVFRGGFTNFKLGPDHRWRVSPRYRLHRSDSLHARPRPPTPAHARPYPPMPCPTPFPAHTFHLSSGFACFLVFPLALNRRTFSHAVLFPPALALSLASPTLTVPSHGCLFHIALNSFVQLWMNEWVVWWAGADCTRGRMTDARPDLLDARVMRLLVDDKTRNMAMGDGLSEAAKMEKAESQRFKYEIVVDGGAGSCRTCGVLGSDQAMIRQDTPFAQFYQPLLQPWRHFIPTDHFFGDLFDRVEWARQHDTQVRRMIVNSHRVAKWGCSLEGRKLYWAVLLVKYAAQALEDPSAVTRPDVVSTCPAPPAKDRMRPAQEESEIVRPEAGWPPVCADKDVARVKQPPCTFFCVKGPMPRNRQVWLNADLFDSVDFVGPHVADMDE
ncbi:unnamed protein product [Closterium sp. Naga37s-1]|nr:unnamed protein product [Closterium sp. Naga37s-1]